MTAYENLTVLQNTKATLYRDVKSICTETCHFLGLDISKAAMETIAELVYKKISVYGTDIEAFAKHAKRTTINAEDIRLLVRRNPSLRAHINAIALNSTTKEKRRKTVVLPVTRQPEVPASSTTKPEENKTEVDNPQEVEKMAVDGTIDLTFD